MVGKRISTCYSLFEQAKKVYKIQRARDIDPILKYIYIYRIKTFGNFYLPNGWKGTDDILLLDTFGQSGNKYTVRAVRWKKRIWIRGAHVVPVEIVVIIVRLDRVIVVPSTVTIATMAITLVSLGISFTNVFYIRVRTKTIYFHGYFSYFNYNYPYI